MIPCVVSSRVFHIRAYYSLQVIRSTTCTCNNKTTFSLSLFLSLYLSIYLYLSLSTVSKHYYKSAVVE